MEKLTRLNQLPLEQCARIKEFETPEDIKRRLMDLGMVRDTKIKPVLKSPAGDPVAYEIRGAVVALRSLVSEAVLVEEVEK